MRAGYLRGELQVGMGRFLSRMNLPDVQKFPDTRGLDIDEVGVSDIRFPLMLPLRDGGCFATVATISMSVALPHVEKGTHMSRFLEVLNERGDWFNPMRTPELLDSLRSRLEAEAAYVTLEFPLFLKREAPVTQLAGQMDFDCVFRAMKAVGEKQESIVGVRVNATSLCPCSKEIAVYGAHNQRSLISIDVASTEEKKIIWFEDLIEIAEESASCRLYPILKRPDEAWVTERAYDNPKFVEDIVRDVAEHLCIMLSRKDIYWFRVCSKNFESIHNHNAIARIERGLRKELVEKWF